MAHTTTPTPKKGTSGIAPTPSSHTTIGRMLHQRLAAPTWTTPIDPAKRQEVSGRLLTAELERLARQQAIENALSMALWHVRHGDTTQALQAATGRAIRATSMLKQACTEATSGGRA